MSSFIDDFKTQMLTFPSITTLISTHCYTNELAHVKGAILPCVCLLTDAGRLVEKIPKYQQYPYRVWVWGKTRASIEDIYDEILDNMHNIRFTDNLGTTNNVPYERTRPIYNYSPDDCHHYLMARWHITVIKP